MDIGRGVDIGCDRCFRIAFNKNVSLLLKSSFINSNQPKVERGAPPSVIFYFQNF